MLSIVASPLTPRRLALIWSMAGLFLLVMLVPAAREFFALEVPPLLDWAAGFGIAALVWSFARLFVPSERPVARRPRVLRRTSLSQTSAGAPHARAAT